MTLKVGTGKFELADESVQDVLDAIAAGAKVVRGCERCKAVCVNDVAECHCCLTYRTRTSGGSPSYYPEDGLHHLTLMSGAEFVAIADAMAAS